MVLWQLLDALGIAGLNNRITQNLRPLEMIMIRHKIGMHSATAKLMYIKGEAVATGATGRDLVNAPGYSSIRMLADTVMDTRGSVGVAGVEFEVGVLEPGISVNLWQQRWKSGRLRRTELSDAVWGASRWLAGLDAIQLVVSNGNLD
ncbi:hypothetical protein WR25_15217 [Diploscapter pachys]|uniref:Uncharacterized protein n=1 Tax=Diploscapter pachys TaxID=2018661 RepID=A0A2A2LUI1_9BILA|nr:hypothetical protein WR25_15217 [Diploscapter pachys]